MAGLQKKSYRAWEEDAPPPRQAEKLMQEIISGFQWWRALSLRRRLRPAVRDLCPAILAGIDEPDKVRTICDGSKSGADERIKNNTKENTPAPTVMNCIHAIHWLTLRLRSGSVPRRAVLDVVPNGHAALSGSRGPRDRGQGSWKD